MDMDTKKYPHPIRHVPIDTPNYCYYYSTSHIQKLFDSRMYFMLGLHLGPRKLASQPLQLYISHVEQISKPWSCLTFGLHQSHHQCRDMILNHSHHFLKAHISTQKDTMISIVGAIRYH